MQKTLELNDLPASVAWLDARDGVVVSILQAPREYIQQDGRWTPRISPGRICIHDTNTLRQRELARPEGEIKTVRLDQGAARMVAVSLPNSPDQTPARVTIWNVSGRQLAQRDFPRTHWDCAWWKGKVAIGVSGGWDEDHSKIEIWTEGLEHRIKQLVVDDDGFEVVAEGDVVAASGIDLHLWWPDEVGSEFSLHESRHAPPGEMGSGVLSRNGLRAAVIHDNRFNRQDEPQAILVRVDALDAEPVLIFDDACRDVAQLAFSPDGSLIALRLSHRPEVRVHRSGDAALVAEIEVPNNRALTWLDDSTLLVGGETLTAWTLR